MAFSIKICNYKCNKKFVGVDTNSSIIEHISMCPTTYDNNRNIITTPAWIDLSNKTQRVSSINSPQLERLTNTQLLSGNIPLDIDGTTIQYYVPPVSTKFLDITYDFQTSYINDSDSMAGFCILASYSGGAYYPILNSFRGIGQATSFRMETSNLSASMEHNDQGIDEGNIRAGRLKLSNLDPDTEYWNFKVQAARYRGGGWGNMQVHEGRYFDQLMFPLIYLSNSDPDLAPPQITLISKK